MKALFLILAVFIAGCASTGAPQKALVPVATECPVPVVPARPKLARIPDGATDTEKARILAQSLEVCKAYAQSLEAALDGYKKETTNGR